MSTIAVPSLGMTGRQRRLLVFAAGYAALWIALWGAARVVDEIGGVSLWFLPAGLRFACLFVLGWPGLLVEVGTILVLQLLRLVFSTGPGPGLPPVQSIAFFYNLFAYAGIAAAVIFPLRKMMPRGVDFSNARHNVLFLGAGLTVALLTATAGTLYLLQSGAVQQADWRSAWVHWALGDLIGIITFAPLLLIHVWPRLEKRLWADADARLQAQPDRTGLDAGNAALEVLTIAVGAVLVVALVSWALGPAGHLPIAALLLLLPLALVILRHNLSGAVVAVALLGAGIVAIVGLFKQGPLAFQYQLVMIAIALVGLWLGGAVEGRAHATRRYRDFAAVSNDLLWEIDAKGQIVRLQGRMARLTGPVLGAGWRQLLVGASPSHVATLEGKLARQEQFTHLDVELRRTGAKSRWFQINGLPVRNNDGAVLGFRGTAVNVSRSYRARDLLKGYNQALEGEVARRTLELQRSHAALARKESHLNLMLEAAPVGVLEFDPAGLCGYMNSNGCVLTGLPLTEVLGRPLLDLVHADDRAQLAQAWAAAQDDPGLQTLEFRMLRTHIWCMASWIQFKPLDSSAATRLMILTDTTSRRRQEESLWNLAHHDPLTGLPNRTLFWDRCNHALSVARRHGSGVAVLWIDLDAFKPVNDLLGHAAGDALLCQVAQRMTSRLRQSDTLARMGGDEFAVILPDISGLDVAMLVASNLVACLNQPFDLPQGQVRVSGSVGVALYPEHADAVQPLALCADAALYDAKRSGQGLIRVWAMPSA